MTDTNLEELKPCPFCGPNTMVECYQDDYKHWVVGCGACGSHTGLYPSRDRQAAVDGWNRRPAGEMESALKIIAVWAELASDYRTTQEKALRDIAKKATDAIE